MQQDSHKVLHPSQNFQNLNLQPVENQSNLKMRPKIIVKNQNTTKSIYQNPITNENFNLYEYAKKDLHRSGKRNFQETPPQINEMKPKIQVMPKNEQKILQKISSHQRNEQILQKVSQFHKKHESSNSNLIGSPEKNQNALLQNILEENEEEIDSETKRILQEAMKRHEVEEIDSDYVSKNKKII